MRAPLILADLAAPLLLGACVTSKTYPTYQQELDTLEADCTARGGILTPSGANSGHVQRDYLCKITGGATRIPQG